MYGSVLYRFLASHPLPHSVLSPTSMPLLKIFFSCFHHPVLLFISCFTLHCSHTYEFIYFDWMRTFFLSVFLLFSSRTSYRNACEYESILFTHTLSLSLGRGFRAANMLMVCMCVRVLLLLLLLPLYDEMNACIILFRQSYNLFLKLALWNFCSCIPYRNIVQYILLLYSSYICILCRYVCVCV